MSISLKFFHGLGDAANFCHVIELCNRRGNDFAIECSPDKACLFKAAGAKIVANAHHNHPFTYPSNIPAAHYWSHADRYAKVKDIWLANKVFHSIAQSFMPPLKGDSAALWHELCNIKMTLPILKEHTSKIEGYLADLPKPLILWHPQGNNSPEIKNLSHSVQLSFLKVVLSSMNGTVIQLDWDNRVAKFNHPRCFHMKDKFKKLFNLYELVYVMSVADLFIGVDSGPLMLTRWTDIPAIGIWVKHYPAYFVLPRDKTVNVVQKKYERLSKLYGEQFNVICSELTGEAIATLAMNYLEKK